MGTIVLPAIIVAVVGLIAGIILTIAAKLMFVPVDERVAAIEEVLPGANCGACGFAGCSDYANALGSDADLSTSLCPVGGADVAAKVAEIMGVAGGEIDPKIAMVMCKGSSEVTNEIQELSRISTCKAAKMFYGGSWSCPYGCLGLGDCADVCKFDAIRVVDGVAQIDREKCVGCEACMKACPNHIINMVGKKNLFVVACQSQAKGAKTRKACSVGCIGCMKCQRECPADAIVIKDNLARIDVSKCVQCGHCSDICPRHIIKVQK